MSMINTHSCILCGFNPKEKCSFFRLKKEWISICNLPETINLSSAYICSKHFPPDDFSQNTTKRIRLKKSATPSIFYQEERSSSTSINDSTVEKTGISYHYCAVCKGRTLQSTSRLPNNEIERSKWVKHFNIECSGDYKNIRICQQHFNYRPTCHQRILKKIIDDVRQNAESYSDMGVTSESPENVEEVEILAASVEGNHCESEVTPRKRKAGDCATLLDPVNETFGTATTPTTSCKKKSRIIFPRYPNDIHTPHLNTPRRAKRSIQLTQNYIEKQKTQIASLQQKLRRTQEKIKNLEDIVIKLREDNILNAQNKP